ncbi:MAG: hypothetical protein IKD08_06835 [Alphaproteobacteria bacterium]|nr:hypothetical protein [Alphaproteobacteria bacterium]
MKSKFNSQKIIIWLVLALIIFSGIYVISFDMEVSPESVTTDITAQAVK